MEKLFQPDDLDPLIKKVVAAPVEFSEDGFDYFFRCPACGEQHHNSCLAQEGKPLVLINSVGNASHGRFAEAGLDAKSSSFLTRILKPYDAKVIAAISCPNTSAVTMKKELDKRGDVLEGYRAITKALIERYKPSKIITCGRHAYELITGRSVPDQSIYGSFTFLDDVPVTGFPTIANELMAPFSRKRLERELTKALETTPNKPDVSNVKLIRVTDASLANQAVTALRQGRFMYYDVEFAGNSLTDKFRLLCLAAHCPDTDEVFLWSESALQSKDTSGPLVELLADASVKKGAHNIKAELLACTRFFPELQNPLKGSKVTNWYADSMLLVYLLGRGGQVRLSTCTEYVGLGGQKDLVGAAVAGASLLIREIRKAIASGSSYQDALACEKEKRANKFKKLVKKGLVEGFKAEGHALKVCRLMADATIDETVAGAKTSVTSVWQKITFDFGNPVDSELLQDAVANHKDDPEAYAYGLIDTELLENYCAKDTFTGAKVAIWAGRQIVNTPGLGEVWFQILSKATEVIAKMERTGLPTSVEQLSSVIEQVDLDIARTEEKLRELGFEGELSKNADIAAYLFDKLGMEPVVLTPKGAASVSNEALEALIAKGSESPAMELIKEHSKAAKIKSSFGQSLIDMVQVDGRIHSTFYTDGTVTGRLSAREPNLQQLPSRVHYAKGIKSAFIGVHNGKPGVMIQLDYSQIELRVAASLSADPAMIEAFQSGGDFHMNTAKLVWGADGVEVGEVERGQAKGINFGLIYNKGDRSLAALLHVSEDRAAEIREQILGKFVALAKKLREWEAFTRQNGYSRTYLWDEEKNLWVPGRLRYLYDVGHEFGGLASKAKNASVNSPIQGTAGDLTLLALIKINKWIEDNNIDASLVLTVHDSIVLTSSFKDAIKTAVNAKRIMEEISPNGVPLVADCEIGLNYGKAIDLKDIIAGAASIANNLPIDDVEKVSGLLQNEPEFGILINLAPYVGDYSEAA